MSTGMAYNDIVLACLAGLLGASTEGTQGTSLPWMPMMVRWQAAGTARMSGVSDGGATMRTGAARRDGQVVFERRSGAHRYFFELAHCQSMKWFS
jgi:hypothetical protein